jgi:transcriptional regulator with XRE-family HTH domain
MSDAPPDDSRDIGPLLRSYREERGLTGGALADRAGLNQSKVSRIETGRTAASVDDVRLLAAGMDLSAEETERLVSLAARRHAPRRRPPRRRPAQVEIVDKQAEVRRAELDSQEIRLFQPTVVPGLLQVSGYAEAVMRNPLRLAGLAGADDSDAALMDAVGLRIQRQRILKLPERRFSFVMTESVLASRIVGPENMLSQIHRIREIAGQENVSIRIIPADARLADPPLHSFELLDDSWVLIDLFHTLVRSGTPAEIKIYRSMFEAMTAVSVGEIGAILDKYVEIYRAELG